MAAELGRGRQIQCFAPGFRFVVVDQVDSIEELASTANRWP